MNCCDNCGTAKHPYKRCGARHCNLRREIFCGHAWVVATVEQEGGIFEEVSCTFDAWLKLGHHVAWFKDGRRWDRCNGFRGGARRNYFEERKTWTGGIREHIINFNDMEANFNPSYTAQLGPAWREDGFKWLKGIMDNMPPPPKNPTCMWKGVTVVLNGVWQDCPEAREFYDILQKCRKQWPDVGSNIEYEPGPKFFIVDPARPASDVSVTLEISDDMETEARAKTTPTPQSPIASPSSSPCG